MPVNPLRFRFLLLRLATVVDVSVSRLYAVSPSKRLLLNTKLKDKVSAYRENVTVNADFNWLLKALRHRSFVRSLTLILNTAGKLTYYILNCYVCFFDLLVMPLS